MANNLREVCMEWQDQENKKAEALHFLYLLTEENAKEIILKYHQSMTPQKKGAGE